MKKTVFIIILLIFSINFACIKQKNRFNEPELTPQNYDATAIRLAEFYYTKHLTNVLERSEKFAISKDDRGRSRDKKYSRLIVADLRVQVPGSDQFTERRNQILCIENYGLRDQTGFNPFDFIMISKYKYEYGLNNVTAYQVVDGDFNNLKEIEKRTFASDEANAFLQSANSLFSIILPLEKLSGSEYNNLFEAIRKKHVFGERTEFLLKSIKLLETFGTVGDLEQTVFYADVEGEDGKKMVFLFTFPPRDVVRKMEKGKTYNNVIVTINENVYYKRERDYTNLGVVNYIRGLEYLRQETSESPSTETTAPQGNR